MNPVRHIAVAALMALATSATAVAQMKDPIISFHTQKYELNGEKNVFSFALGAVEPIEVEIDFGFGPETYKIGVADYDPSTGQIAPTYISGTVSEEGNVKIYGNPLYLDYVDLEGVYADELDISKLVNLDVLNVSHNSIPELDLTAMRRLSALYVEDNPFGRKPLMIGADHPSLTILEMSNVGSLDQSFDISSYPSLMSFSAFHTADLRHCDPTGCPKLVRLSIDCTNVGSLDLSRNPDLLILNISETQIRSIDVSACPKLQQLYCSHQGVFNNSFKIGQLDVGNNPDLVYLFCAGNQLKDLDITGNPLLIDLNAADNYLTSIDFSGSPDLYNVNIAGNCMDFVTLPAPRPTFGEYYYSQRPLQFDRSYPVGGEIDLESRLNRPGSVTKASLLTVAGDELDDEYYTYSDGLILFHKECPDSVYFSFSNSDFEEYPLQSTRFVVKSVEDFGKDVAMVSYRLKPSARNVALRVGLAGATPENPKRFSVDFGDGNPVDFTATTDLLPAQANASGEKKAVGAMTLYIPEGEDLTAFGISDTPLSVIDMAAAHSLQYLEVKGCTLSDINLAYNSSLRTLNLDDNSLSRLDLTAAERGDSKNLLTEVSAAGNEISEFVNNENLTPLSISLADNRLQTFSLSKNAYIEHLDLAGNMLTALDLNDCEALATLDISGNNLSGLEIPPYTPLRDLDISGNRFPLTAMPLPGDFDRYVYAPQQPWGMPQKAPVIDLSEQMLNVDGKSTEFKWYTADSDRQLTSGEIEASGACFRFKDTSVGAVYATWSHPLFPDFKGDDIYRSENVTPAEMPTHVALSFTTEKAVESTLIMRSAIPNNFVYIDWAGDGNMVQYKLSDQTYQIFPVTTYAGADVRIYTYDERDAISVFSMSGVPMSRIDLSAMTDLTALNLSEDDLSADSIILPRTPVTELTLSGNDVEGIDFGIYESLVTLVLSDCGLSEFDASPYKSLERLVLSNNGMNAITLDNPNMWELVLVNNEFEQIDLSGAPRLEQLWLGTNWLRSIDVSMLRNLKVLQLDHNCFTLTTLPRIMSTYNVYYYGNQALYPIKVRDGNVVDLSDQLMVGVNRTTYRWFRNADVGYLEDGTVCGDEMTPGVSYTEEDGVFTFIEEVSDAVCLMTNAAFPELLYLSTPVDIKGNGVEGISDGGMLGVVAGNGMIEVTDAEGTVALYSADGMMISSAEAVGGSVRFDGITSGIYVVSASARVAKVFVK